ncbi:Homeodomain-like protein [Hesseltinella vesiculosa]|uniref:Homeodomain-like protein n=1 Tax=Hesseltinella vesiculosa TaxID=101127 RepID=A0A1X2GU10_9FUNG|nr:Homeodomain-like protein [Hesseltinella vesiculosa]
MDAKIRVFSPVILFHESDLMKHRSSERYVEDHKRRIDEMLESNSRFWLDIIARSRDVSNDRHSPVPSLVSSPTPPLSHRDLPSPPVHSPPPPPPLSTRRRDSTTSRGRKASAGSVHHPYGKPPSPSSSSSNSTDNGAKRRRGNLPKAVTAILREWLAEHKKHPYPTEDEKDYLAKRTGLTLNQISNWFINARRRILQPMLDQEDEQKHHANLDILPFQASGTKYRRAPVLLESPSSR